ncbi:alpha/beta fold hydrolase [Asticcacaulis taihuensis]|uniref:alpha/beta fold hydrolase n=1 Tax=Asticcacaulis taihuensis TaxID=260084 RepID=UPI003F7BBE57
MPGRGTDARSALVVGYLAFLPGAPHDRRMTPILLVPGLLCTPEVFAPQSAALEPYGPVIVADTLQGDTIPEIAAHILANAPPRFALAGISMGGYICFEILRQAPERVIKLALLDTTARPDTLEQTTQRRALIALSRKASFKTLLAQMLVTLVHPSHRRNAHLREVQIRMGLAVGIDGMARQQEAIIARADSRPDLPNIAVPTLVLVGDKDPLTPPDRAEEIASAIPNARLVIVPECGHLSTLEQPEAVNRALIDWLSPAE